MKYTGADDEAISWLWSPEKIKHTLTDIGFSIDQIEDHTEIGFEWFSGVLQRVKENGPPPVGLHLLMGEDAALKMKNTAKNLDKKSIRLYQGVLRR